MRGRPPKPLALKILAGNPGKRKLRRDVVQGAGVARDRDFLTDRARAMWRDLGPSLRRRGLLTKDDEKAFAAYCQSVATYEEAMLACRGKRFDAELARIHRIALHALREADRLGAKFGWTPADRERLHAAVPGSGGRAGHDPDREFLFGMSTPTSESDATGDHGHG